MVISYACNPQIHDVDSEFVKYRKNNIYEENCKASAPYQQALYYTITANNYWKNYLNSLLSDAVFKKKNQLRFLSYNGDMKVHT